jgi:hypothetical protein
MPSWIDGALYPGIDVTEELTTLADRVDFLCRLCSSWDFGVLPDRETIEEIRRPRVARGGGRDGAAHLLGDTRTGSSPAQTSSRLAVG